MVSLQFPEPRFRMRTEAGVEQIFDGLRRKWLVLTPEEWVRQNMVQYLLQVARYPDALVAMEKEISVNGLRRRFDILVYDRGHRPWLMLECKAPEVPLTDAVLRQLLRYHSAVPVPYLAITNGTACFLWKKEEGRLESLPGFPALPDEPVND